MPTVELSFEHVKGPQPAERRAVFMHGILGSGPNLRTLARRFVTARPGWDAWLVDLRGHGDSPKGTPEPSLAAVAEDVRALCARSLPVGALIGHSFGGKVALSVLRAGITDGAGAGGPLGHVVTLDTNPGVRVPPRERDTPLAVLETLATLPATFASRAAFVDSLVAHGKSRTLAQWLAMSTAPVPEGGVRFALDLGELRALLTSYFADDLWPVVEAPPEPTRVHLVIAERSVSYASEDRARAHEIAARSERTTVDTLPTDHWIHAEDPEGVLRVLLSRIPQ